MEAKLLELKARIEVCLVSAAGMTADNMSRERRGEAMAWTGPEFFELCDLLEGYADQLAVLARESEA